MQTLCDIRANNLLDVIRRAAARLPSLHVYDRAERARERASASCVKASCRTRSQMNTLGREQRRWRAFQIRKVVHVIVDRLHVTAERIISYLFKPSSSLTDHDRGPH